MLTADEVRRLAALSQIFLTEEELAELTLELAHALAFVGLMDEAEVGGND